MSGALEAFAGGGRGGKRGVWRLERAVNGCSWRARSGAAAAVRRGRQQPGLGESGFGGGGTADRSTVPMELAGVEGGAAGEAEKADDVDGAAAVAAAEA